MPPIIPELSSSRFDYLAYFGSVKAWNFTVDFLSMDFCFSMDERILAVKKTRKKKVETDFPWVLLENFKGTRPRPDVCPALPALVVKL